MALWEYADLEGKIMVSKTRLIRGLTLAASAAWLGLVMPGPGPAKADDWWNSMLGMVGMGPKQQPADDSIDYSARPALVVPPKMDLPPPQTAVARPADWPKDPDVAARHRAEADSRRPAPPAAPGDASADTSADDSGQADQPAVAPAPAAAEGGLAGDKQVSVPWAGAASVSSGTPQQQGTGDKRVFAPWGGHGGNTALNAAPQQDCNEIAGMPVCLGSWDWFGFAKNDDSKGVQTLKVGVAPPREYLTQPPSDYRAPVAVDSQPDVSSVQDAKPPVDVGPAAGDQIGKTVSSR
jgi:hypothetical protein